MAEASSCPEEEAAGAGGAALSALDDAAGFWNRMPAADIPTKKALHADFLREIQASHERIVRSPYGNLLDLGCGDGRLSVELAASFPKFRILGVDVNSDAVVAAQARAAGVAAASDLRFEVGDGTRLQEVGESFDVVLLQLVLSIVGAQAQRKALLSCAHSLLADGGRMLLSVSGASADINAEYAALYERDEALTGEERTYFSRKADGTFLYPTHHFTEEELRNLLSECGLSVVSFAKEREASSRRPDQAAWFFYVIVCRSDCSTTKRPVGLQYGVPEDGESHGPPLKRMRRRSAMAPGSEAFSAAVCMGLQEMQPFQTGKGSADCSGNGSHEVSESEEQEEE